MKRVIRGLLLGMLLGAGALYADEATESAETMAGATYDADTATLTLDGVITNVTEEAELGAASTVVMKNGGGVAFTLAAATNLLTLAKTYTIVGDGLAATGVISVAEGLQVTCATKATLAAGTLGHVLVKRGAGALEFATGAGPNAVSAATRWIVEEGALRQGGGDFFGNHSSTTTNLTVDVREGATYAAFSGHHCPMGPLELTGGTMTVWSGVDTTWAGTALRGGVVAHASARESFIRANGDIHLNHVYEDVSFVVERGAVLTVEALLVNGFNQAATARVDNRLLVSGGGTLRLLSRNGFSGGVKVSDGTTLVLGNAFALGEAQTLELDGDATVEVLAGVTIPNLAVTGNGTLTKTGAGALTVASQAEGVTLVRAEGEGTAGSCLVDGALVLDDEDGLYTSTRDYAIDVPTGSTLELTEIRRASGTLRSNITKTGGGTLVVAATNMPSTITHLVVREGAVQAGNADKLNSGMITLMNGSALVVTNSAERWGTITVKGEGVFDVAEGATFTVRSNSFNVAGTTLRKRGAGTLYLGPDVWFFAQSTTKNVRLIAEEGTLKLGQDPFGGHSTAPDSVVEVESGATLTAARHVPLGHVILRGGTIRHLGYPPYQETDYAAMEDPYQGMLASDPWMGFTFNGTIEAQPSPDGRASVIRGSRFYAAHAANETVFDVAEGATLRLEGGRFDNGVGAVVTQTKASGFTKRGAGEFVLDLDAGLLGTVRLEEGTLTLGANGRLPDAARVSADPDTTLRLEDGATLGAGLETDDAFLFTADVWLDASRLLATPGARVTTVPNRGTAGGTFRKFTVSTRNSYQIPTAPVYSNAVINGKGALFFDGGSALVLDAYTNRTATMTVFMVAEWTTWEKKVGLGKWGGELSMCTATAVNDDNNTVGSFHFETANGIADTYVRAHSLDNGNLHADNANRAVGTPYLNELALTGEKLLFRQYVGAAVEDATLQAGQVAGKTFAIDLVAVGGRLAPGGMCQYFGDRTSGGNRMFIGHVGELLVFTRALTDDEKLHVRAYLKKKWFADETAALPETVATNMAQVITVDVPSGTAGLAGTWGMEEASARTGRLQLRKTGAGALALRARVANAADVDVQAGTLELSGKMIPPRADVWFDATDAATVTTNAEGRVAAVANKGRAGGAFGAAPGRYGTTVPLPIYEADGLAGKGAVAFDWNAGLSLSTYTNVGERAISVYLVAQRTAYEDNAGKGKWGGPFSFIGTAATADDQMVNGTLHVEDTQADGETKVSVFAGQSYGARVLASGALEDPYLMIVHQQAVNGAVAAFEWANTATNALETFKHSTSSTLDVNRVLLGGRGTTGGVMQWERTNASNNRTWSGRIGEMLVFTKPLSVAEQTALLAYLRAKWFAKGDGATAAPAFVGGAYGQPDLGPAATLRVAAGATVEQGGPTLALAALEAEDGAAWRRVGAFADPLAYTLFDVAGDLTFGAHQTLFAEALPAATVRLFGGTAATAADWTVTGDVTAGSRVVRRADGLYLLRDGGTVIFMR